MKPHPYLRAYMAGITIPTMFLLVGLTLLLAVRGHRGFPVPLEGFAVFPMAVVPNVWGAWNMLRTGSAAARRIPLGLYGAILPVLLPPLGYALARTIGFEFPVVPASVVGVGWVVAVIVYYLVWKHLVGFLNEMLGVHG